MGLLLLAALLVLLQLFSFILWIHVKLSEFRDGAVEIHNGKVCWRFPGGSKRASLTLIGVAVGKDYLYLSTRNHFPWFRGWWLHPSSKAAAIARQIEGVTGLAAQNAKKRFIFTQRAKGSLVVWIPLLILQAAFFIYAWRVGGERVHSVVKAGIFNPGVILLVLVAPFAAALVEMWADLAVARIRWNR